MNWQDKIEVKKGNLGEDIIDRYVRSIGLIPYFPNHEGAHPFDRLCATQNKKYLCIVDAKSKARRTYYPDTGINYKTYQEYKYLRDKYSIDVWLFFVDEDMQLIYGGKLKNLEREITIQWRNKDISYPRIETNRLGTKEIYFPVDSMKIIHELTVEEVTQLKNHSNRNYQYFSKAGINA